MSEISNVKRQLLISAEMDQRLNTIAHESGATPAEIVAKALNLYLIAVEKKRAGLRLGFAMDSESFETEVIGL